jgi:starch synthase
MLHTIERASEYYRNHADIWKTLQIRGMSGDYSWNHSAKEYLKLYESLFQSKETEKTADNEPNPVVVDI